MATKSATNYSLQHNLSALYPSMENLNEYLKTINYRNGGTLERPKRRKIIRVIIWMILQKVVIGKSKVFIDLILFLIEKGINKNNARRYLISSENGTKIPEFRKQDLNVNTVNKGNTKVLHEKQRHTKWWCRVWQNLAIAIKQLYKNNP